jgi:hypothetical protein
MAQPPLQLQWSQPLPPQRSHCFLQQQSSHTVYAITSRDLTGVVGSSLAMTSSHAIGHFSVAL